MIRRSFYDYLQDELAQGGLWEWAKDRPYQQVIVKPEIICAHDRAWRRLQEAQTKRE